MAVISAIEMTPLSNQTLFKLKIHGICMTLAFGFFLPIAAITARYYKNVGSSSKSWWLRLHVLFVFFGISCAAIGFGFIFSALGFQGRSSGTSASFSVHSVLGCFLIFFLVVQSIFGYFAHRSYNEEAKRESSYDKFHSLNGKLLILLGAINIFLGIQRFSTLFSFDYDPFISLILATWITTSVFFFIIIVTLEVYLGKGSRYYSGNIFAAAKNLGAKKMFSLSPSKRNDAIRRASLDLGLPSDAEYDVEPQMDSTLKALASFAREKEGNLSPFLYRPTWDAGLRKATPIHKIAAVEDHMIKENSSPSKSIPADLLTRLKEAESVPRSRSNSVNRYAPSLESSRSSVNSFIAAEELNANSQSKPKLTPKVSRNRARSTTSRPSSMFSRQSSITGEFSLGARENSFILKNEAVAVNEKQHDEDVDSVTSTAGVLDRLSYKLKISNSKKTPDQ